MFVLVILQWSKSMYSHRKIDVVQHDNNEQQLFAFLLSMYRVYKYIYITYYHTNKDAVWCSAIHINCWKFCILTSILPSSLEYCPLPLNFRGCSGDRLLLRVWQMPAVFWGADHVMAKLCHAIRIALGLACVSQAPLSQFVTILKVVNTDPTWKCWKPMKTMKTGTKTSQNSAWLADSRHSNLLSVLCIICSPWVWARFGFALLEKFHVCPWIPSCKQQKLPKCPQPSRSHRWIGSLAVAPFVTQTFTVSSFAGASR